MRKAFAADFITDSTGYSYKKKGRVSFMGCIKIREGIYSVGVLNPNMRIFDVIMRTEYGTSYNAYLVRGKRRR